MQYFKLAVIGMRHGMCIANPVYTTKEQAIEEMNKIKKGIQNPSYRWHSIVEGFDGVKFELDTRNLRESGVSFAIEPVEVMQSEENQ